MLINKVLVEQITYGSVRCHSTGVVSGSQKIEKTRSSLPLSVVTTPPRKETTVFSNNTYRSECVIGKY